MFQVDLDVYLYSVHYQLINPNNNSLFWVCVNLAGDSHQAELRAKVLHLAPNLWRHSFSNELQIAKADIYIILLFGMN